MLRSILVAVALVSSAPAQDALNPDIVAETARGRAYSPYANRAFPVEVYFGDVHVHTGLSADAGGGGTRLMPRDAYRFARGEQVTSNTGLPVKLRQPFDFLAVADHSDAMGAITDILSGAPNIMADPYGRDLHRRFNAGGVEAGRAAAEMVARFAQGDVPEALNYQPGNPAYRTTWERIVEAAEEFNDPGTFTTLIGYEWTSLVSGNNLHRVVLFRDGADRALRVVPYTTTRPIGSPDPRDLWAWMQEYEDETGGRVLAIPHNGNLSNGSMFPLVDEFRGDEPLDEEYARLRIRWEPLAEVTQPKGDGETHPLLSPDDAFADFETWDTGNLDLSEAKTQDMLAGEYAREALKRGLAIAARTGVNPYQFGMIGSSDIHTALSTPSEDNFFGKTTPDEPRSGRATHLSKSNPELGLDRFGWEYTTPGLVAVWARENTRRSIYDAMAMRETYATTGTRIRVRFFGGWEFDESDAQGRDLAFTGYTKGVPMGRELGAVPDAGGAPSFLVYALRDAMGANLDRVQVVKGWLDAEGQTREKIYDVAWSDEREPDANGVVPPVKSTVELTIPSWTNTVGAAELGTVWTDPDFDPTERAFYYARVIEIPTPRWTAYDAVRFGVDLPAEIPLTVQERAYTSPIWFTPTGR
ncbi:MAG: DUF3604 domain-containing protein [Planctomycetota bacterium]